MKIFHAFTKSAANVRSRFKYLSKIRINNCWSFTFMIFKNFKTCHQGSSKRGNNNDININISHFLTTVLALLNSYLCNGAIFKIRIPFQIKVLLFFLIVLSMLLGNLFLCNIVIRLCMANEIDHQIL